MRRGTGWGLSLVGFLGGAVGGGTRGCRPTLYYGRAGPMGSAGGAGGGRGRTPPLRIAWGAVHGRRADRGVRPYARGIFPRTDLMRMNCHLPRTESLHQPTAGPPPFRQGRQRVFGGAGGGPMWASAPTDAFKGCGSRPLSRGGATTALLTQESLFRGYGLPRPVGALASQ